MGSPPASSVLATIPSAFAAACRLSRTDGELFERCLTALVRRFQSDRIWFTITGGTDDISRVGPAEGFEHSVEVARLASGETELVIRADPEVAPELRGVAMPLALGLTLVVYVAVAV